MKQGTKRKAGEWLVDVAKYILTAAVISSFLGEFREKWMYYGVGLFSIGICLVVGFITIDKTEKE